MNSWSDNFYLDDLLSSLREDTTLARYWQLIPLRESLRCELSRLNVRFRDDVTDETLTALKTRFDNESVRLFARFLHLYDFNPAKLREIRPYQGSDAYPVLAGLLRLPGVRLLRAELYYNSGVTLEALAEKSVDDIQSMVRQYVEREHRPESVPFPKEISCHREVAKMILHRSAAESPEN